MHRQTEPKACKASICASDDGPSVTPSKITVTQWPNAGTIPISTRVADPPGVLPKSRNNAARDAYASTINSSGGAVESWLGTPPATKVRRINSCFARSREIELLQPCSSSNLRHLTVISESRSV